jgi:rhodanese-related sulfurtransferase
MYRAPSTLHPGRFLLKTARLPKDKDREIAIYCEHGQRAWIAKKLLAARGCRNTTLLAGYFGGLEEGCLWKNRKEHGYSGN